ncbi:MAG: sugar phosphate isomerase/epimerase [Phycisphaerae bacterium]|nr:sugar phosphate isomerase/epimerase [Phycisphaerae bacterium]
MKLGFLTRYSDHVVEVARRIGFDGLELQAGSWGDPPPSTATAARTRCTGARDHLREAGITVTALGLYGNHLVGKPSVARKQFASVMNVGDVLGCKVIASLVGRLPNTTLSENMSAFKKIFGPIAKMAHDRGFKIAFENWSGFHGYPFHGTNVAYRPEAWDMLFDAVDSPALGLEFDPSHLHFQMMDYVKLVHRFGKKIFHVHAKDTEIFRDKLEENGIFSSGWWRFRVPGWGEINWMKFISALQDVGYDGGIAIEHEDGVYSGDRFDEGLQLGYNTLAPLLAR